MAKQLEGKVFMVVRNVVKFQSTKYGTNREPKWEIFKLNTVQYIPELENRRKTLGK